MRDAWLAKNRGGPLALYTAGFHYVCLDLLRAATEGKDAVHELWAAIPRYESLNGLGLELGQLQTATKQLLDAAALTLPRWDQEETPGTLVAFSGSARTLRAKNRSRDPDALTIYLRSGGRQLNLPIDNRWVARSGGARCLELDRTRVCGICRLDDKTEEPARTIIVATPVVIAAPLVPVAMALNSSARHYRLCTVILPSPKGYTGITDGD